MGQLFIEKQTFSDVLVIRPVFHQDDRGSLIKFFSAEEISDYGIKFTVVEEALIRNNPNVLRGVHFQIDMKQSKLLTCISGMVWVALVNIDKSSLSLGKVMTLELQPETALFIPGQYAIGTFSNDESLLNIAYGERYDPDLSSGIIWNDEDLAINWPISNGPIISSKDKELQTFKEYACSDSCFMR